MSQAYLLDALIGQVLAFVNDRTRSQKENWLVMGVGTKGASTSVSSNNTDSNSSNNRKNNNEESAIPFFISTYTSSTKKYVALRKLTRPISQLDVLPTVLRWLNVPPYDEATESVLSGLNNNSNNTIDEKIE